MDEKALGKRLQLARKRAGLTQQELCQKAGLSYSTLAKIERGAIKAPSIFTVSAIAAASGTPLEELVDLQSNNLSSPTLANPKKRSKTGVRFVYFDVNGTLVRFFERAFTEIAKQSNKPVEIVETLFWRHDGQACRATETNEQVNKIFAEELDMPGFDWQKYYLENVEITPHAADLVKWVSDHYEVGLLTNNWLGYTDAMMQKNLIPDVKYTAIVESARYGCSKPDPKIYEIGQEMAGVEASEIMLVDDDQAYLVGADQHGWHGMRFDGFHPEESIERVKQALEF